MSGLSRAGRKAVALIHRYQEWGSVPQVFTSFEPVDPGADKELVEHRGGPVGVLDVLDVAVAYDVEHDPELANHYYELAAVMGPDRFRGKTGLFNPRDYHAAEVTAGSELVRQWVLVDYLFRD